MQSLELILRESAIRHTHLCPRQVLGARMGMLAGEILKLDLPRADKKLLVIAETDGCFFDYAPKAGNDWETMLLGFQLIPADNLIIQRVQFINSLTDLISKPTKKSECKICGEEIIKIRLSMSPIVKTYSDRI